jgi:hypothetical protein
MLVAYGEKCTPKTGKELAKILEISTVGFEEKYLGIPVPEGHMKNGKLQPIKERYRKMFCDWKKSMLLVEQKKS